MAHFTVHESGEHEIVIAYPRNVSDRLDNELHEIRGIAVLTGDKRRVDTGIPSGRQVWEAAGEFGIFSLPLKRGREYTLLLQISQIPEDLARSLGTLRVRQDRNNSLSFFLPLNSALVLSLLSLLSVPPIWRKAWERKRPFLLIVVVATAMTIVGLVGFRIISNSGLTDFIIRGSFVCTGIGPLVLILSLASWVLFSVISFFKHIRPPKAKPHSQSG